MSGRNPGPIRTFAPPAALALLLFLLPLAASAQGLGTLVSPGPLSKYHAKLEGIENCQKCHEPGKRVTVQKCLDCHKPIAEEIAARKGVHRNAGRECATCHVEHAGVDADTRRLNTKAFDHKGETGFPLDGRHKGLDCAKCHKTRSFLTAKPECAACHDDPHKGVLGASCATCHPVSAAFKDTRKVFDHSKTSYPLTGAHVSTACEKCHAAKVWKGIKFASCVDCHKDPHAKPLGTCATCHTTATFRMAGASGAAAASKAGTGAAAGTAAPAGAAPATGAPPVKFDHAKTGYALVGRHAAVACATCHVQPATKVHLKYARCADCHKDPHAGIFKLQDCNACHKETGFKEGTFDHSKTKFPLVGKHTPLACAACHKGAAPQPGVPSAKRTVDFRGARSLCSSCHVDAHKGQLGTACETCHTAATFKVTTYQHPRFPEFFAGEHAPVACEKCHGADAAEGSVSVGPGRTVPVRKFKGVSLDCAACHKDPHLGQVGKDCASCHRVGVAKFAVPRFDHLKTKYPLTGKHVGLDCAKCHKKETGSFPTGSGTAVRLTGLATDCVGCHKDVHLGQLGTTCQTCHTTATFEVKSYQHKNPALKGFFVDKHATAECRLCHKKTEGRFLAGMGTAVKFAGLPTSDCQRCHDDPHRGKLGADCASCHNTAFWRTANRAFHKSVNFPLEGQHLAVPCASCHWEGVYKGTPNTCYDCHWIRRQDDLYRTVLGTDCGQCHRPTSWTAVLWSHAAQTGFALNAAHSTLRCDQCHKNRVFAGTPAACYSCHAKDYQGAKNPDHVAGGFPTACESCHLPGNPTWLSARFNHGGFFPLAGAHATQTCASCHKNGVYKGTPRDCFTCHRTDFQSATTPVNHAGFPTTCDTCHAFADATWQQKMPFNHSAYFPLAGTHVTTPCANCHKNGNYTTVPTNPCSACHQQDYQTATTPVNHVAAGFPTTCDTCHKFADATWMQGTFDHSTFALAGAHATALCADCHKNAVYRGTTRDCATCHQTDLQKATTPVNHAGFPTTCDTCHAFSDATWQQKSPFNHSTYFPLAGTHVTTACANCHTNGNYATVPTSPCSACHQTDFQTATTPVNHAGFPTTCDTCHKFSDATWMLATFNHATVFPLAGAHATTACANCHKNNNYTTVPTTPCSACHLQDYQTATTPVNHVAAGFGTTCDTCHKFSDATWLVATFSHTTFTLSGAHATALCADCHKNAIYRGTTRDCATCHQTDFQNATTPVNHAGFPTTCDTCHAFADATWKQKTPFNHSAYFPLAGTHVTTPCANCHKNGNYTTVPKTPCSSCHQTDFQNATTPVNHAGFPTTCETCHAFPDATWQVKTPFNHSTYFALVGAHSTTACANCHKNNNYTTIPTSPCSGCHLTDFQNSKNPPHVAAGFPTTCDTCHKFSDATWQLGTFTNHSTVFPLAGAHLTTACANCHKNNNFTTIPTSPCSACHQTDFQTATTPVNHAGFPTTCETCHAYSDATWQQKTPFNHSTYFALAGAHSTTPCANCHKSGNYTTVPTTPCSSCHQTDFQNATTPVNHAGFPTTCETCHAYADATWQVKTPFNHSTYFALAGTHSTTACANCHKNNNFTTIPTTPCSACHQTDFQNATTPVNHAGFPTTCETCHAFSDATWQVKTPFNHSAYFPLAGTHVTTPCTNCHKNGNYTTVPTTPCSACHLPDYQTATTPVNHITAAFPTTCDTCHKFSDATWLLATFNHSTVFPLAGAHATTACANCHKNNNYTTVPTSPCSACHLTDFQNATTPVNHAGFPTTCDTCHAFSDSTWQVKTPFNHSAYFPLAGTHVTTPCANCHKNGNYTTVPTSPCSACHMNDYNTAKSPVDHIASSFPTTCDSCHKFSDATWLLATFSHTTFPLVGVHATTACAVCHNPPYAPSANNYTAVPTTCYGCHLRDFTSAATPVNHAGFPTTCNTCHAFSDATWQVKSPFNHSAYFPLAGTHVTTPCANCHKSGNYTTVPTTPCSACHLADYQTAKTPVDHVAAGFPTTCDTCHKFSDATWLLAVFNHTWFPTNHGSAGRVCANCHTTPSNYLLFSCTGCHALASIASHHSSVRGFVYQSQACYSCHPQGRAG